MRRRAFALTAIALLMISSCSAVLMLGTDEAEATYVNAPAGPYWFNQDISINIRNELPKGSSWQACSSGDTFKVTRGAWDVWYGGWLNTKYERYVDITSVKWASRGDSAGISWDSSGIWGKAPFGWGTDGTYGADIRVEWVLRYSDHGSGTHKIEDSGYFIINIRAPVAVQLDYGDRTAWQYGPVSVTLPHAPKEGYIHVGWEHLGTVYPAGTTWNRRMASAVDGIRFTAVYEKEHYTVSFDSAGGSTIAPKQVAVGGTYGTLPTPTKEGYSFLGWYDGSTKVSSSSAPTKDVTLRAEWSANIIQYTAPPSGNNLAAGVLWTHQLSTTPGVVITVSGADTSWVKVNGGTVSGVPPTAGVYEVSVTLTAPNYISQSQSITLNVVPKLVVTNSPAAGAIAHVVP